MKISSKKSHSFSTPLFSGSQALLVMAGSIYNLALMFIVAQTSPSQFVNSLLGNLGVFVSIACTLFIGEFVDRHSPWHIILWSEIILVPACLVPLLAVHLSPVVFLLAVAIVDITAVFFSEADSVARTAYINHAATKAAIPTLQRHISLINSGASIAGFLLVFALITLVAPSDFLVIASGLYAVSAVCFWLLPASRRYMPQAATHSHLIADLKHTIAHSRTHQLGSILGAEIGLMMRNQLMMSLVIYKVGQLAPNYRHIHLIGLGLFIALAGGAVINRLLTPLPPLIQKIAGSILCLGATLCTLLTAHWLTGANPIVVGLVIGGIFGCGIPVYSLLETTRMLKTADEMQGKSIAFVHFCGILLTLIITIILGIIQGITNISSLYFDASATITLIIAAIFLVIRLIATPKH